MNYGTQFSKLLGSLLFDSREQKMSFATGQRIYCDFCSAENFETMADDSLESYL